MINLVKILEKAPHVKREGDAFLLSEELDANLFVTIGEEVLQIARVARIELSGDLATFTTHRSEKFFFAPDQVAGLRLGGEGRANRSSAGFVSKGGAG